VICGRWGRMWLPALLLRDLLILRPHNFITPTFRPDSVLAHSRLFYLETPSSIGVDGIGRSSLGSVGRCRIAVVRVGKRLEVISQH
jgi:hypothetical protein